MASVPEGAEVSGWMLREGGVWLTSLGYGGETGRRLASGVRGKALVYCDNARGFWGLHMFLSRGKKGIVMEGEAGCCFVHGGGTELTAQAHVLVCMTAQPYAV